MVAPVTTTTDDELWTLNFKASITAGKAIPDFDCLDDLHIQVVVDLHCVSKNVPPLTCYNVDIHDSITIIFGRSVTEVRNQMMHCFPTLPI